MFRNSQVAPHFFYRIFPARPLALTLIELLVAILVFALVLIPVVKVLVHGIRGTHASIDELFATNYAVSLLEELKLVPYNNLPDIGPAMKDSELSCAFPATPLSIQPVPPPFERSVSIETLSEKTKDPHHPSNSKWGSVKKIQVRVSWQSLSTGSIKGELSLSRLVADEEKLLE